MGHPLRQRAIIGEPRSGASSGRVHLIVRAQSLWRMRQRYTAECLSACKGLWSRWPESLSHFGAESLKTERSARVPHESPTGR